MVISIFFKQFLECFGLNLVLLTGAKLKPSKSKYIYVLKGNVIHFVQGFPPHSVDSPRLCHKIEKILQSLSPLNPCRLYIEIHLCMQYILLAKNQLGSPEMRLLYCCRKIGPRKYRYLKVPRQ